MSQEEINGYLKKYQRRWFNSTQLGEVFGVSRVSMNRCLHRMRKHDEVNGKMVRVMLKGKLGCLIGKDVPFYSYKRV